MLTERDHDAIAAIVNGLPIQRPTYPRDPINLVHLYRGELLKHLVMYFANDNPRFDVGRFKAACIGAKTFEGGMRRDDGIRGTWQKDEDS